MTDTILKKKTILCLINAAAYSRTYFEELAPKLIAEGYRVVFALDSHLSDVLYAENCSLKDAWYFTDYLKSKLPLDETALQSQKSWASLYSDFDRFLTMDIVPPLNANGAVQYRDIPEMLSRFFAEIFIEEEVTAVLYEPVSNSFAIAAFERAQAAGVPFLSLSPSRIPGRIELSSTGALADDVTIGDLFARSHNGGISDESRKIAEQYVAQIDHSVPDYMKINGLDQVSLLKKYFNMDKFRHFMRGWRYSRQYREDCALAYQHGNPVKLSIAYFKRSLSRRLKLGRAMKEYAVTTKEEPYLLYPLHFHPESSTSVLAADYLDEMNTIKAIAFRLPVGVMLYVKEHPSAVALQPLSFYRQLNALPNVRLLAAHLRTKEIVRRSCGVVTLTSTVGFEAAVLNKPVIALGTVFYSYFPNVQRVHDYSELGPALQRLLSYQPVSPQILIDATAAYVEFGSPGSFDFRNSLGDDAALSGVARLVHLKLDELLTVTKEVG
ncbi:capsular polysaccharide export protein, LipB/KpsS family [Janthinobacterium sp. RB2P8]|uniref:capsular polysaccharide export protein, LipB/KpsS family n=1 Tax=Janthinobacterium sp. RB2P8 TaxID=3424191 RepID=UPI003F2784DB